MYFDKKWCYPSYFSKSQSPYFIKLLASFSHSKDTVSTWLDGGVLTCIILYVYVYQNSRFAQNTYLDYWFLISNISNIEFKIILSFNLEIIKHFLPISLKEIPHVYKTFLSIIINLS